MQLILLLLILLFPLSAKAQDVQLSRDVYLEGIIDDQAAWAISKQLTDIDSSNPGKEIVMHITSPGGSVYAGLKIYDTMHGLHSPVRTVCEGFCASMAAVILAAGNVRQAQENATILVHGVSLKDVQGTLPEIYNEFTEAARLQGILYAILMTHTHKGLKDTMQMCSYDHYLSAQDAVNNGIIDGVI